jgi:hypothetical protein
MGSSVEQIDRTYGHMLRGLLDTFDAAAQAVGEPGTSRST